MDAPTFEWRNDTTSGDYALVASVGNKYVAFHCDLGQSSAFLEEEVVPIVAYALWSAFEGWPPKLSEHMSHKRTLEIGRKLLLREARLKAYEKLSVRAYREFAGLTT